MANVNPLSAPAARPTGDDRHRDDDQSWIPTAITVVLVLGCAGTLLLTDHDLLDALAGAFGTALVSYQVAQRVSTSSRPIPTVIVSAAIAAFAVILVAVGYALPAALMAAGIGALLAGAAADRMFGGRS